MSNILKGKYGENLASKYLESKGYKIIEKNYKYSRYGEIDIIAMTKEGVLCFVEVKTRTNDKFGEPLEAITKDKLSKIYTSIQGYIKERKLKFEKYRIDAISVYLNENNPKVTHIENIQI